MRKISLLMLVFVMASCNLWAQWVLFKPGPAIGADTWIQKNDVCTSWNDQNFGTVHEITGSAWTWYTLECGTGTIRGLLRFDQLNTLPPGATVTYAELRLYGIHDNGWGGNSLYPDSPFPESNDGWVRRVTSPWAEMGVTWNTQPSITTADEVPVPASTSEWNYNVSLNVTKQVNAMLSPGQNHGFMLMLDSENYYRALSFASSDYYDNALWPELYLEYSMPCDAGFRYFKNSKAPNVYNFSIENVWPGYTYKWNFGDGSSGDGPVAGHVYTQRGTYRVCAEAFDERTGQTCQQCISICIEDIPPCDVSYTAEIAEDWGARFIAQTTVGRQAVSYKWDFGDSSVSYDGPLVDYVYKQPGVYQVCLDVKYDNDCEASYCRYITIGENSLQTNITTTSDVWPRDKAPNSKTTSPAGATSRTAGAAPRATAAGAKATPGNRPPFTRDISKPAAGVKISPNPSGSATVTATINAATAGTYKYVIYDAQGKPALTGSKGLAQGVQNIQLSVKALQPGKYWIEFSSNRQQLRTSFVKL